MRTHLHITLQSYPRQFWLLFTGLFISITGSSLVWPFLMIYVSGRLDLPLTAVASLMTINAFAGLISSFLAGPVIDRVGRKWVMVVSLAVNALAYILMSGANTLGAFAVLMGLSGAFNPLYRIGADAMMADLIAPERRIDAYSLLRMSNNMGIAIGPAFGGFIATRSYSAAFYFAAAGMLIYSLLVTLFAKETLPKDAARPKDRPERFGGYDLILRDRPFMEFVLVITLTQVSVTMLWVLLGVYAKENFGLSESLYGLIPMTNALMVVFLQLFVTQKTRFRPPLRMLALGALFYAVGVGSIALGRGFWGFWASMVIMTIGELILTPTATTLVANLAPADMRGRYMSLYGLTWGVAAGIGPVLGGFLNDTFNPQSIWLGGFWVGLAGAAGFFLMGRHRLQTESGTKTM